LATVAALMAVMLVVSAAPPAFAHPPSSNVDCAGGWKRFGGNLIGASPLNPGSEDADRDGNGMVCIYQRTDPKTDTAVLLYADDHDHSTQ
jgi:hypothetical protein